MGNTQGISTDYDRVYAGHITPLQSDAQIPIGTRFIIHYTLNASKRFISASVLIDGTDGATFYLLAQVCYIQNRCRCHYVQMNLPSQELIIMTT